MKINLHPVQNLYAFGAKKAETRKADDIMRTSVREFPMLSSSRFEMFSTANIKRNESSRYSQFCDKLKSKILYMRDINKLPTEDNALINDLKSIKKSGIGNCSEASKAALAALLANGYKDSYRVRLFYNSDIIEKSSGKTVFRSFDPLDHNFVVTSMGKNSDKPEDQIIIDSWAGFTASYSDATAIYKGMFDYDIKHICDKKNLSVLKLNMREHNLNFNPDDYEIKGKIAFCPLDDYTIRESEEAADIIKEEYPKLKSDKF